MPLNTTPASIQRRAAEELALKLSIEDDVAKQFRALFRTIAMDMGAVIAETGEAPSASVYRQDVADILNKLYRDASVEVRRTARDGIKSQWQDLETKEALDVDEFDNEEIAALVEAELRKFQASAVASGAALITQTTNDHLNQAVVTVQADAAAEGIVLNDAALGAAASDEFLRLSEPRPQRIAETETLNAVEGAKSIEVDAMIAAGAMVRGAPLQEVTIRQWVTVGDDVVRPSHNDADGQLRKVGEAFVVGGSLLRWPGDRALGAPAKEVVNCRCGAFTIIDERALAMAA